MRESRNPFRLRRSESIDDAAFLNLFEPGILEILDKQTWYDKVHPIRSAAGGGKTSLLRLFTPSVMHALHNRQSEEHLKELYKKLKDIGALDERGPKLLGAMLVCGRNYAMLQDLKIDQTRKNRLFFSLLNVRIVLAVLRASMALKELRYPDDLERLVVQSLESDELPNDLQLPCNGMQLFKWAASQESKICRTLDSFGPLRDASLPGHETLFSLPLVRPEALLIDGDRIAERTLIMFDDIHKLTESQREFLIETVIELRSPIGVWIAERFEALTTAEMLASGATTGRDFEMPISIESYWRRSYQRFERHALTIADRRVRAATSTELEEFQPYLQETLEGGQWDARFEHAASVIADRLNQRTQGSTRFDEWIRATTDQTGTPRERALAWKSLEILLERESRRRQKVLFDEPIPVDELGRKSDSSLTNAAELFLANEFGLPYYYGTERICRLASLNIQQFLGLAGDVFEEVLSGPVVGETSPTLPAERQHALMKIAAKTVWDEIPNRVKHGRELRTFLAGVGEFAKSYTYRPTAPNDPGVGGTAIRMSERASLMDSTYLQSRPDHQKLANVLASALAHNLLIADLDYKCKSESWMVLNLNRLLCVHFDLPLGYGLYKEQPLKRLAGWIDRPFVTPQNEESLL